jgi:hypothetical protein
VVSNVAKHDGPEVALVGEVLPPELARLLATARKEITEHGNDHGLCVVCGSAFPCERAELAAFALDAV